MSHHPVLLDEVIVHLKVKKGGLYIDATLGEGGYSLEILKKGGKVLGIDLDFQQIQNLKSKIQSRDLKLIQENFKDIERIAKEHGFFPVDGVVFDLGLSMRQLSGLERGFSFKNEKEPLDMRLDLNEEKTAADYINTLSEQNLYDLFAKNSEEINSRTVAVSVIRGRAVRKIKTAGDLVRIVDKAIGRRDEKVLARIFQALRIEVNHEFENLKKGLEGAKNVIKKDGRILVVTFHSLEDRMVKQFVRNNGLRFDTKKPITAPNGYRYERSAKLRVII
jgi:16S rRNA (cytosine1402-N4)-methyltransferase